MAEIRRLSNMIDITGQRFSRLVAIRQAPGRFNRKIKWVCKCDCGNEALVLGCALRGGTTKSCGCWMREVHKQQKGVAHSQWKGDHTKRGSEAYFNRLVGCSKTYAQKKGHESIDITGAALSRLYEQHPHTCDHCGKPETKHTPLCIDHCHTTGRFLGFLCRSCNHGKGLLGDTPESILKMYHYTLGKSLCGLS